MEKNLNILNHQAVWNKFPLFLKRLQLKNKAFLKTVHMLFKYH